MKIAADDFPDVFQVPENMQTSGIWDAIIKYFVGHNRIFLNAKFVFTDEIIEINNLHSLSQVGLRDASEIQKIEIQTLPMKAALHVLFKKLDALRIRIIKEIYDPLQQILDSNVTDEAQTIKLNLFEQTPKKLELLSEMSNILFRFIYVKKFSDIRAECEILEELIKRINTVIQHQDMSTLVHLFSYELVQLLDKLNSRFNSEIAHFVI